MSARARILALDQGTSATKCLLVDDSGTIVSRGSAELEQHHPRPGWVEQDAEALWESVCAAVDACLADRPDDTVEIVALSSQRESAVAFDHASGEPLSAVIGWQDRRTAAKCQALRTPDIARLVRERSGLPLDPMFSAAKMAWLLGEDEALRASARAGRARLGTVDAFLMRRLCGGDRIEAGNASRTQLLCTHAVAWDDELLAIFDVPRAALPAVVASTEPSERITGIARLAGARVCAVLGDSHAALFGHGATAPGEVKATYGTGSSVMGLLQPSAELDPGLCLTIAWQTGRTAFAAEGNILATGAALRWLAQLLEIDDDELAALAARGDADGVSLVPAFAGLAAPWWDVGATAVISGLTMRSNRSSLARATLESVAHQIADVLDAFDRCAPVAEELFTDGGPTRNDVLMQLQADVLGRPVVRSRDIELSALGAAHLAGLAAGVWTDDDLARLPRHSDRFEPAASFDRTSARARWLDALERARFRPATAHHAFTST